MVDVVGLFSCVSCPAFTSISKTRYKPMVSNGGKGAPLLEHHRELKCACHGWLLTVAFGAFSLLRFCTGPKEIKELFPALKLAVAFAVVGVSPVSVYPDCALWLEDFVAKSSRKHLWWVHMCEGMACIYASR